MYPAQTVCSLLRCTLVHVYTDAYRTGLERIEG